MYFHWMAQLLTLVCFVCSVRCLCREDQNSLTWKDESSKAEVSFSEQNLFVVCRHCRRCKRFIFSSTTLEPLDRQRKGNKTK